MKAFALTWHGARVEELTVATCPNLDAALAAVRASNSPTINGVAAASASDLNLSGPTLAVLFNKLLDKAVPGDNTENHVARFKDRESGARRVFTLLEEHFKDAPEAAAPSTGNTSAAPETNNEDDMATKGKKKVKKAAKAKVAKAPREKKVREPRPKKDRSYKDEVVSKGSEKRMGEALKLIERKNGATATEIKDGLGVSLGTAKNLVWYLRRDGHKIVVDRASERRPYVIG